MGKSLLKEEFKFRGGQIKIIVFLQVLKETKQKFYFKHDNPSELNVIMSINVIRFFFSFEKNIKVIRLFQGYQSQSLHYQKFYSQNRKLPEIKIQVLSPLSVSVSKAKKPHFQ